MVSLMVRFGAFAAEKYFVVGIWVFRALIAEILEIKTGMIFTLEIDWPVGRTDVDNSMARSFFRVS